MADKEGFNYIPLGLLIETGDTWAAKPNDAQGSAVVTHNGTPEAYGFTAELGTKLTDFAYLPSEKIMPCMSCHGASAEGKGVAPRLASQNAKYIQNELRKFHSGDRKHALEMTMVTRDLDAAQTRAAAFYLQSR